MTEERASGPGVVRDFTQDNADREIAQAVRAEIEKIRPYVQADGGDIEFRGYKKGRVEVSLLGACTTCPSSILTLKAGIEARLKEQIPDVDSVVTV